MSDRSLMAEPPAKAANKAAEPNLTRHVGVRERTSAHEGAQQAARNSKVGGNPPALPATRNQARVLDDDEGRAIVTRWLVEDLAPRLGFDPSRVEIHVNEAAESRLNARGASGLMEDGRVYLHPGRYDPRTQRGRYLLAHETAHVAQRSREAKRAAVDEAESEARSIGEAFAARTTIHATRAALPLLAAAADKDAESALQPPQRLNATTVNETRFREIGAIKEILHSWWISDGDVFHVLEILFAMPFDVAAAVVNALEAGERHDLINNINPPHLKNSRTQVLECYQGMEPEEFARFDEDLFEEMTLGGLEVEEQEAAFYGLSHLPKKAIRKLLESENRLGVEQVLYALDAQQLNPDAKAKRKERFEQQEKTEGDTAKANEKAKQDLGNLDGGDSAAAKTMDDIRAALDLKPKGAEKREAKHGPPVDVLNILLPLGADKTKFEYFGQAMDQEGLIEQLIEKLPADQRFDSDDHRNTFLALLNTRLPEKNIALAESLVSYGLFKWSISDEQAEFAYRLIKILPLTAQARFRRRDNGKWLVRIERHINEKEVSKRGGPYEGIEVRESTDAEVEELRKEGLNVRTEDKLIDVGHLNAQIAKEGRDAKFDELKAGFEERLKKDPQQLYKDLLALSAPADEKHEVKEAAALHYLEAVVHDLDRQGYIDKLFGALGDDFLFAEENRLSTLHIMVSRDPVHVRRHALDLLDSGFLGLRGISDRQAWLAFQLVRALPDADREAFIRQNPDAWKDMQSKMSAGMRADSDLNLYIDRGGRDRASVMGQLTLKENWDEKENADKLDGLIRMAIAMTEHKYVFEKSREFKAFDKPHLKQIVADYSLYDSNADPKRETYTPSRIERSQDGFLSGLRTLVKGIAFLWHNDLLLLPRSAKARNLDLHEAQDILGGDIAGVRLAKRGAQDKKPDEVVSSGANRLSLNVDTKAHVADATMDELVVESMNIQTAGGTYQTGRLVIKDLALHAAYDSDDMAQPTRAQVSATSIELGNMLMISRGSMTAVKRILVKMLNAGVGTSNAFTENKTKAGGGSYLPFPFKTILAGLFLIFRAKAFMSQATAEAEPAVEQVRDILLTFSSLQVDGITTSGGQSVGRVEVQDFALRVGLNKAAYLRARVGSLNARLTKLSKQNAPSSRTAPLQAELDKASPELTRLEKIELQILELRQRGKKEAKASDDTDPRKPDPIQLQIDAMQKELLTGGAVLDIGSAKVSGISGTVTTSDVELGAMHGEGQSAALGIGFVTDAELVRRIAGGKQAPALMEQAGDTDFKLEIDRIETTAGKTRDGNALPELTVRSMPTADDIDKRLKEIDESRVKRHDASFMEEDRIKLVEIQHALEDYERYAAKGISSLDDTERGEFERAYDLLSHSDELISLAVQHIRLDKVEVGIDFKNKGVTLGAGEVTATGIRMPAKGLSLGEIHGRGIKASAAAEGGVAGWLDPRKNLKSGNLHADELEFKDFKNQHSGMSIGDIKLQDLGVDARRQKGSTTLGVHAGKIEVKDISTETALPVLQYQSQKLHALKKPNKAEKTRMKEIDHLVSALQESMRQLDEANAIVNSKTTTEEEKKDAARLQESAEQNIAFVKKQMSIKRLTVDDLNLEISGLGDVLDPNYSFDNDLAGKVKIRGTGQGGAMISGATVENVSAQHGAAEGTWIDAASLGAIRGSVTYGNNGIDFDGLEMDRLELGNFAYLAPGVSIWGSRGKGPTGVISTLKLTGHIETPLRDAEAPDGDRYMSRVVLQSFSIEALQCNGIHYLNDNTNIEVELKAATLRKIEAEGLTINLPKTDDEHMHVRGGQAGIGAIQNMRVSAALASGMAVNAQADLSGLHAKFAEDGAVSIDLDNLGVGGRITKKNLDVEFNAKARGLHIGLIPGKKGYEDATKKFGVKHLDEVSAHGLVGANDFSAKVTGGSIGEVTDDGKTITAPEIHLPLFQLESLNWDLPDYHISVPSGSPVVLEGTTLGVTLERNLDPKTKEQNSLSRVTVSHLLIPSIKVHGLQVVFRKLIEDHELTLTLPHGVEGTIDNLEVKVDQAHPEGLVLDPAKGWDFVGMVGFTSANLRQVMVEVPGIVKRATTDVTAGSLQLEGLTDGTKKVDLTSLTLSELEADLYGSQFSLKSGASRFKDKPAGTTAAGIHYVSQGADKGLSIDSLGLHGLKYHNDDLGLTMEIQDASLSGADAGFKMPDKGPIEIPHLKIETATFRIDDLMNMGSPGPGALGDPTKIDPKILGFMDHLDGNIKARVKIDDSWLHRLTQAGFAQTEFPVVANISNGQLDFATLADKLFTAEDLREAIKFTVKDNKLVIEFDGKTLLAKWGAEAGEVLWGLPGAVAGGIGGLGAGALATTELYSWKLDPKDPMGNEVEAAEHGQVRTRTLTKKWLPDGTTPAPAKAPGFFDKKIDEFIAQIKDVDITVTDFDLSLKGGSEIDLANITKGTKGPSITGQIILGKLGGDAISHLTVKGNNKTGFNLGFQQINVGVRDLAMDAGGKHLKINVPTIHVDKMDDAKLNFDKGRSGAVKHLNIFPSQLEGTITKADAEDIRVEMSDIPKPPAGATK
jgi:hypothetical protein